VADEIKFGMGRTARPGVCVVCESMLPDAVDGMLSAEEQRAFDTHVAGCVECAQEFEDAQRGAAWLGMLKAQTPEPPADLLAKILAGTTGVAGSMAASPAFVAAPVEKHAGASGSGFGRWVSGFSSKLAGAFSFDGARATFQPRLAMTAAMAFFSIALTLNLTGVRLKDLRASNFTPSGMKRTVADMSASATRSFQNLRVVYQVESRVSELREDERLDRQRQPESAGGEEKQAAPTLQDGVQRSKPAPSSNTPNDNVPDGQQGMLVPSQPKQAPKPQGSSDLVVPMPQRMIRGGLVARKEV